MSIFLVYGALITYSSLNIYPQLNYTPIAETIKKDKNNSENVYITIKILIEVELYYIYF